MKPILLRDWADLLLDIELPTSLVYISGVAIDSRQVLPGDLFFALPGEQVDGHTFLQDAAKAGAVAAIVSQNYTGNDFGMTLIRVPDPIQALRLAGENKANLFQGHIIGITGSLGKTSTKGFATSLLSTEYTCFASPKSYNSQLTVPLSILMADGDEDFLLLEMATSEPGNIQNLLKVVSPDIAVITNIAHQHVTRFPNQTQGIAEEKGLLLKHSQLQILPKDSAWYDYFIQQNPQAEQISFSFSTPFADFFYKAIHPDYVEVHTPDGEIDLQVSFPYQPAYQNFLIALTLGWAVNVPLERMLSVLSQLRLPPMRFEHSLHNGIQVINDTYNACPEAMLAALDHLPQPSEGGKVILILGHMADLGSYSEEGHSIVALKAIHKAHTIFFVGEKWLPIQPMLPNTSSCQIIFHTKKQTLEGTLKQVIKKGDVVLLKGSRSLALETLLNSF